MIGRLDLWCGLVCAAALALAVRPAFAQPPPDVQPNRPYRGIFGGTRGDKDPVLTADLSLGGGDETAGLSRPTDSADGSFLAPEQRNESFGSASGDLTYVISGAALSFRASGAGTARYYGVTPHELIATAGGGAGGSVQLTSATRLDVNANLSYQPFYEFSFFPDPLDPVFGVAPIGNFELGVGTDDVWTQTEHAGISHNLSRQSSVAFSYDRSSSRYGTAAPALETDSVGGSFSYQLSRGLSAYVGVMHGIDDYGVDAAAPGVPHYQNDSLNAGLSFDRALSISRRLTFSFTSGSTTVSDGVNTTYFVTGSARLTRQIGRTWDASVAYMRDVNFIGAFGVPTFADSLSTDVSGLISRRLQVDLFAGWSTGAVGLGPGANGYRAYQAGSALTYGLTRTLGVQAGYTYYRYLFDNTSSLPPGAFRQLDRQMVSVNLSVWAPLVERRPRRPHAAR